MADSASFRPAWWLPGPHLQSVWSVVARSRRRVRFHREALTTPDGDSLLLDHVLTVEGTTPTPADRPGPPRLLLLHGMEGSSYSPHVQAMAASAIQRGWRVTCLNFRSCARDPHDLSRWIGNRRPRLYHSGETGDLDFVVETLRAREPATPLAAWAISLGANVLLKWLGERGRDARLAAAVALSPPCDLAGGAAALESSIGRLYAMHYLKELRPKVLGLMLLHPSRTAHLDGRRVREARSFLEFDDAAVAPLHGFRDAADYHAKSSSLFYLGAIETPTLVLASRDDPFQPASLLPRVEQAASAAVRILVTDRGGHAGFVSGRSPLAPLYWADEASMVWLSRHFAEVQDAAA